MSWTVKRILAITWITQNQSSYHREIANEQLHHRPKATASDRRNGSTTAREQKTRPQTASTTPRKRDCEHHNEHGHASTTMTATHRIAAARPHTRPQLSRDHSSAASTNGRNREWSRRDRRRRAVPLSLCVFVFVFSSF